MGLRPAGCACRPRHDAAAGSRDPGSLYSAARAIHPRPPRTPVSEPGSGVSDLSALKKGMQGWIRTASTRRIVRRVKKPPVQQRRPLPAAETGRSCWGCGRQDARAAQGTMQPLGAATRAPYTAWLAQSTCAHQKTATYQNTLRFCFTMLFPAVSASPSHQSSCARILFCTISPAGVRARMRPSKVAYPARTQFCTKVSCAVENCLPYRVL